jgi:hypothetical protein
VETRLLNRPDLPDNLGREPVWPLEQVPPPGQDATLLAVVPIPGTGTSLAIVGYAIATEAVPRDAPATLAPGAPEPAGTMASPAQRASAAEPDAGDPAAGAGVPGLQLDEPQRRVWAGGREILLTFQEFELLAFLSAHPATVFTRADLVARLWDCAPAGEKRTRPLKP